MTTLETYRNPSFLRAQAERILDFYARAFETLGTTPFPQSLRMSGAPGENHGRHLVSACRYVVNFCRAHTQLKDPRAKAWAQAAWSQLCDDFLDETEGRDWLWQINPDGEADGSQQMYGVAFVILAHARALELGFHGAKSALERAFDRAERLFWLAGDGLYADEGQVVEGEFERGDYRGQNANMHACEALLVAHGVTGEGRYLARAEQIAHRLCVEIAAVSDGDICEHYDRDWRPDWTYNREDPKNLYRPWGVQIGHQIEWAKLLIMLGHHAPTASKWSHPRARELFDRAMARGWDPAYGGLVYGIDREANICDGDKHFWVQAEALAAAALVAQNTEQADHWQAYAQLWTYAQRHFIDEAGVWRRVLDRQHRAVDNYAALPGAKVDYHTLGAIFDILEAAEG